MAISRTIMRNNLKRGPLFIGLVCGGGYGKDAGVASKERIIGWCVVGGGELVIDCHNVDTGLKTTNNQQPTTDN